MKLVNLIAAGVLTTAIALAPVVTIAQDNNAAVKQEKKDIRKTEDKKAANIAQRNRAEKNGHPKQAVKDEKKVQKDNAKLHHEHKELKKDVKK
jgi:hypothetical protein